MAPSRSRASELGGCITGGDTMNFGKIAIAFGVGLLSLGAAHAAPLNQKVDLEHVQIIWTVGHGDFSKVMGQFRQINKADFVFDREDVSKSSVKVEVEAA